MWLKVIECLVHQSVTYQQDAIERTLLGCCHLVAVWQWRWWAKTLTQWALMTTEYVAHRVCQVCASEHRRARSEHYLLMSVSQQTQPCTDRRSSAPSCFMTALSVNRYRRLYDPTVLCWHANTFQHLIFPRYTLRSLSDLMCICCLLLLYIIIVKKNLAVYNAF